jgi:hypothetical protein
MGRLMRFREATLRWNPGTLIQESAIEPGCIQCMAEGPMQIRGLFLPKGQFEGTGKQYKSIGRNNSKNNRLLS